MRPSVVRKARGRRAPATGPALAALLAACLAAAPAAPVRAADAVATTVPGLAGGSAPAVAAVSGLPERAAAADSAVATAPGVDFLWVTRSALVTPEEIARVVERARSMGVRGLLVQVVGRGDAWYRSGRLPRPEALARSPRDYDPLAEVIARARPAGLEVHAWVNCALVWSAERAPSDPRHVVRAHPEWFAALPGGRSLARSGPAGWRRLRIEGAYLSPSSAGARAWIAGHAAEIARGYDVDGIHLDYIRTPGIDAGFDAASRVAFALETGVDRDRRASLPAAERTRSDTAFAAFQARQVTAIVREVRDSVRAVRPGLMLSAAVRPDAAEAARGYGQPWLAWLEEGLLDRAFPMCYSPDTQTVLDQLLRVGDPALRARVVPGIAVYNAGPTRVASHLKGVRALGFEHLALYSYDSLFSRARYWERLHELLAPGHDAPPRGTP